MKQMKMGLLPALVLGGLSGTASAAGFQLMEQNASGLGNAFAGSAAVAENASTIYYNPAGMTQLKGSNLSLGVDYISLKANFANKGSTGAYTGAQSVDGGDSAFVPNGYISHQINDQWFVGLGLGAPFGMRTNYPQSWKGAYTAMDTDIKSANLNPSVAFKVNETVSLGLGASYQLFQATYSQELPPPGGPLGAAVVKVKGDSSEWGWNAGALFTLSEATRVGVSYRSSIKHHITGDWSCQGGASCTAAYGTGGKASLDLEVPDMWVLSAYHRLNDRWELMGDLSKTGWSSVPKLAINLPGFGGNPQAQLTKPYDWSDTTRVAFGANYAFTDALKLRLGLAFDQSVVDDAHRTARLPDQRRVWYTVGAQYKPSKSTAVDVGYAYIKANTAKISDTSALVPGSVLNGEFDSNVQVLGVQYSLNF